MTQPEASTEPVTPSVLEAVDLRKVYQLRGPASRSPFVAVDGVSFAVPPRGSLAIVGESGSGKTTVAKMLVGLERPSSGTITINGIDRTVARRRAAARRVRGREIQIVFQDPYTSLDPRQTVGDCLREVVALHQEGSGADSTIRAHELAALVGLDARQVRARPRELSGGQRQRVAIARALAARPKIIVLDESLAPLDVSIQAQVLNLLADIHAETGVVYVLISHDLAVVRQVTDDIIVMRRGVLVESGRTAQVLDHPATEYTQLLRDSVPQPGWHPQARRVPAAAERP